MSSLTIVLPTYNGARFLRQQIESILGQSDPYFTLLAIDDGSTDETVEIIDEYVRLDGRVTRLPATGNAGQRRRIAELVNHVSTEFLAFADQDDIWESDRNAKLLSAIGDKPLVFGRSQLIDAEGQPYGISLLDGLGIDPFRASPLKSLFRPLVSAHAAIVRMSWLDPSVFSGALPFDHALGLAAQLSGGLVYVDNAIVNHRLHGQNQMNATAVIQKSKRWISPYRLRATTSFVLLDRLNLYMTLDQISRVSSVGSRTSHIFSNAAAACRYSWFQRLKFEFAAGRKLERVLHSLLDDLAISPHDRELFSFRIRSVTRSQSSVVNLQNGARRYFIQTELPAYLNN